MVVLAEEGGAAVDAPACVGELHGEALETVLAELGVGGGGIEAAVGELGVALLLVVSALADAGGDAALLELEHEVEGVALAGDGGDGLVEGVFVSLAGGHVRETGVVA